MSNGLDPDQDRDFVGPDLGRNCKIISRRQKLLPARKEIRKALSLYIFSRSSSGNALVALSWTCVCMIVGFREPKCTEDDLQRLVRLFGLLSPRFLKKASGILQSPPSLRHAISS